MDTNTSTEGEKCDYTNISYLSLFTSSIRCRCRVFILMHSPMETSPVAPPPRVCPSRHLLWQF